MNKIGKQIKIQRCDPVLNGVILYQTTNKLHIA